MNERELICHVKGTHSIGEKLLWNKEAMRKELLFALFLSFEMFLSLLAQVGLKFYITQAVLEPNIPLTQPLEDWGYRHVPLCHFCYFLKK